MFCVNGADPQQGWVCVCVRVYTSTILFATCFRSCEFLLEAWIGKENRTKNQRPRSTQTAHIAVIWKTHTKPKSITHFGFQFEVVSRCGYAQIQGTTPFHCQELFLAIHNTEQSTNNLNRALTLCQSIASKKILVALNVYTIWYAWEISNYFLRDDGDDDVDDEGNGINKSDFFSFSFFAYISFSCCLYIFGGPIVTVIRYIVPTYTHFAKWRNASFYKCETSFILYG